MGLVGLDAHVSRCIYGVGGAVREVSIKMMKTWGDNLCQRQMEKGSRCHLY